MKPKTIDEILGVLFLDGVSWSSAGESEVWRQQAITSAKAQIQQLLEECAPEKMHKEEFGQTWFNQAISQYKSNLMEKMK